MKCFQLSFAIVGILASCLCLELNAGSIVTKRKKKKKAKSAVILGLPLRELEKLFKSPVERSASFSTASTVVSVIQQISCSLSKSQQVNQDPNFDEADCADSRAEEDKALDRKYDFEAYSNQEAS